MKIKLKIINDKGEVKLDTFKRRLLFFVMLIFCFVAITISIVTFIWLPYWIISGRNIFTDIFKIQF